MVLFLLISICQAYGSNLCREFTPDQMVPDFDMEQFYGVWFPVYTTKSTPYVWGICPI